MLSMAFGVSASAAQPSERKAVTAAARDFEKGRAVNGDGVRNAIDVIHRYATASERNHARENSMSFAFASLKKRSSLAIRDAAKQITFD
jgi:hypothetical protein